jgi:hypothetical protein
MPIDTRRAQKHICARRQAAGGTATVPCESSGDVSRPAAPTCGPRAASTPTRARCGGPDCHRTPHGMVSLAAPRPLGAMPASQRAGSLMQSTCAGCRRPKDGVVVSKPGPKEEV